MEVIRDLKRLFPSVMDRAYELSKEFRHVNDIMSHEVITITSEASMKEAAKTMGEKHIGSLIVVENKKPVGIITERDLLSYVLALGINPEKLKVGSMMSSPLISIGPSATIKEAAQMMIRRKGRLAVFDSGDLVGVITASDLIKSLPWVSKTRLKVDDFMTKKVITSDAATTVADIVRILGERRIGSVVITRKKKPEGIFTERDLLTKFLARERDMSVHVGEVCSSPVYVILSGTKVNDAAAVMVSKHIRRLPIVADDELIGIITARDLVEAYAK